MNLVYLEGVLQIANVILAIFVGFMALSLFRRAWSKESLKAWRYLIFALILFAAEEAFGALKAFGIFSTPYLTHIVPSAILGLVIGALILQIDVVKRGLK